MTVPIVQAQYDSLEEIARRFDERADNTEKMVRHLYQMLERLERGGWEGDSAAAFFREMNDEIMPTTNNLRSAFTEAAETSREIARVIEAAEQEATNQFDLTTDGGQFTGRSNGVTPYVPPRQSANYQPRPTNVTISNVHATANNQLEQIVDGVGGWLWRNKEEIGAVAIGIGVTAAIIATAPASLPALAVAGVAGAAGAGVSSLFYNKAEHNIAVEDTLQTRDFWVDTSIGAVSGVVGGAVAKHGVSTIMSKAGVRVPSFISSNGRFFGTEWAKGVAARQGPNALRATQVGITMGAEGTTEGVLSGGEQIVRNVVDGDTDTKWHYLVLDSAGTGFVSGAATGGVIDMRLNRSIEVDGQFAGNSINDVIHRQGFMSDAERDMHASILRNPVAQDLGITSIQVTGGRMENAAGLYNRNHIKPSTRLPLDNRTTYPLNPSNATLEDHFMPEFRTRVPGERYIQLPNGTYREATRTEIENAVSNLIANPNKQHKRQNLPGLGHDELDAFFGYVDDNGTTRMLTPKQMYDNAMNKGYEAIPKYATDAYGNEVVQSVRIPALEEAIAGPNGIYTNYYREHPLAPEILPGESMSDMLTRQARERDPYADPVEWELDDWAKLDVYYDPKVKFPESSNKIDLDQWRGIRVGYDDAGNVISSRPQLAPWQRPIPGGRNTFYDARANGTLDELNTQMGPYDNIRETKERIEEYQDELLKQQRRNSSQDQ